MYRCPFCSGKKISFSPDGDGAYCDDCGAGFDPADAMLAELEATHYVWFDDEDRPRLASGTAFAENAVRLDNIRA